MMFVFAAIVSFATYAGVGYGVAALVGLGTSGRVLAGVGLSLGLFVLAWCAERISPMSSRRGSGGFIRLNFGWHHLWFAPGFLLMRWMR